MKRKYFIIGVTIMCAALLIFSMQSVKSAFMPGTNTTFSWIGSDTIADVLHSNKLPILIYGHTQKDENFSFGFEMTIFTDKNVVDYSKQFVCIKSNIDNIGEVNNISSILKEISGRTIAVPPSTFVMMLTCKGIEVHNLSKTMEPGIFATYMKETIDKNGKTK
ncbi:MAG: hypothetical protein A2161_15305 [Candidatus Schekmanbacteria bacterium RBG_13_48_7]|uniref:Uncharacterized protein n=1 Tax=Candidatus Schekmanbacteria bacterium RBG_13_48_7 TaxID=1817878 RepID=A0A1F7RNJ6_9BACT|nr:MAG: hypothetical protein A2161_15305 [Candidatus Schekmanbacteria bacterium RBG_13_48_7]